MIRGLRGLRKRTIVVEQLQSMSKAILFFGAVTLDTGVAKSVFREAIPMALTVP
jgi:hypothetical protein